MDLFLAELLERSRDDARVRFLTSRSRVEHAEDRSSVEVADKTEIRSKPSTRFCLLWEEGRRFDVGRSPLFQPPPPFFTTGIEDQLLFIYFKTLILKTLKD